MQLTVENKVNNFQQFKLPENKSQIKEVTIKVILKTTLIKIQIMTSDKYF